MRQAEQRLPGEAQDHSARRRRSHVAARGGSNSRYRAGRAVLRVPQFLPSDAQLIGADTVVGDDGRLLLVGLHYRLGQSDADVGNADLWINYDLYTPRPLAFVTSDRRPGLGTVIAAPRVLTARGKGAIYQEATNPPGLHRSLAIRSSLNWFEDDGSFWAVQAYGLDLATLVAIAESLTDYSGGGGGIP